MTHLLGLNINRQSVTAVSDEVSSPSNVSRLTRWTRMARKICLKLTPPFGRGEGVAFILFRCRPNRGHPSSASALSCLSGREFEVHASKLNKRRYLRRQYFLVYTLGIEQPAAACLRCSASRLTAGSINLRIAMMPGARKVQYRRNLERETGSVAIARVSVRNTELPEPSLSARSVNTILT